jgi:hypothetical protein
MNLLGISASDNSLNKMSCVMIVPRYQLLPRIGDVANGLLRPVTDTAAALQTTLVSNIQNTVLIF